MNSDKIEAIKGCLDPNLGHIGQMRIQKSTKFKFKLRKKLYQYHHFVANFFQQIVSRMVIVLKPLKDVKIPKWVIEALLRAKNR